MPKAFVVGDDTLSPEEVMSFVANNVSPHKKIRRVEFLDEIPKSPAGKILRRILIEREQATVGKTNPPDNQAAEEEST